MRPEIDILGVFSFLQLRHPDEVFHLVAEPGKMTVDDCSAVPQLQIKSFTIPSERGSDTRNETVANGINPKAGSTLGAYIEAAVEMPGSIIAEFRRQFRADLERPGIITIDLRDRD